MSETILVEGVALLPITISEERERHLFNLLLDPTTMKERLGRSLEEVLGVMLKSNMTKVPERKAVMLDWMCLKSGRLLTSLSRKIGIDFPDHIFETACRAFAPAKVSRTTRENLICSHQGRNPERKDWGGSARLTFKLLPKKGESFHLTHIGAPSGLKEWEDLTLLLGAYHRLHLIQFSTPQVQAILDAADAAVADQPEFQPDDMNIKEFAKKLFDSLG